MRIRKIPSLSVCDSVTGTFQIQRAHLQTKNQEKTHRTKPMALRRNVAAEPKDKGIAMAQLNKSRTSRSRALARELNGSPIKKMKIRR